MLNRTATNTQLTRRVLQLLALVAVGSTGGVSCIFSNEKIDESTTSFSTTGGVTSSSSTGEPGSSGPTSTTQAGPEASGSESTVASSGIVSTGDSTVSAEDSTASGEATTGAKVTCEIWDGHCDCGLPVDCGNDMGDPELFGCGPLGRFDEEGCLRRPCTSTRECGVGGACFTPTTCQPDACVSSAIICGLDGDQCTWGAAGDCSAVQGWCVAEGDLPDCP